MFASFVDFLSIPDLGRWIRVCKKLLEVIIRLKVGFALPNVTLLALLRHVIEEESTNFLFKQLSHLERWHWLLGIFCTYRVHL